MKSPEIQKRWNDDLGLDLPPPGRAGFDRFLARTAALGARGQGLGREARLILIWSGSDVRTVADVPDEAGEIAAGWLDTFAAALQAQDAASVAATFLPDGHWRDVLAFTWDVVTHSGRAAIEAALAPVLARTDAKDVRMPDRRTPPRRVKRAGVECIETIFEFDTAFGHANAVVRLVESEGTWRAWSLLTTLEELHGWPDGKPRELSDAERYSRDFGGANWLDQRTKAQAYEDRDPTRARGRRRPGGARHRRAPAGLGVDTLIVDRHKRIGDNWRRRYHSLTLHNEVHVNHLPLMPFPSTFPVFIPKDKLANWFEAYVETLDLNYWTDTQLMSGFYDEAARRWTVTLKRGDGTERLLHPRHVVFATGVSAIPIKPSLPGLDAFAGTVCIPAPTPMAPPGRVAGRSWSAPATAATTWRRISAPAAPR